MTQTILAALIAAAASVICQLIITNREKIKEEERRALRQQALDNSIEELRKRVTEHNNYAKLFQKTTENIANLSSDIRVMGVDIKYLKEKK